MATTECGVQPTSAASGFDSRPSPDEMLDQVMERMRQHEALLQSHIKARAEVIYHERLRTGTAGTQESDWQQAERQIARELDRIAHETAAGNKKKNVLAHGSVDAI